jgi:hypothetical protein
VALVRKAVDEIRITIFFKSFESKKINELVGISITNFQIISRAWLRVVSGQMWPAGFQLNHADFVISKDVI